MHDLTCPKTRGCAPVDFPSQSPRLLPIMTALYGVEYLSPSVFNRPESEILPEPIT
jgi:hypothetical protein